MSGWKLWTAEQGATQDNLAQLGIVDFFLSTCVRYQDDDLRQFISSE